MLCLGFDIGSTTVKAVLREDDRILFERYERHLSRVREKALEMAEALRPYAGDRPFRVAVSGSAGLGLAEAAHLSFVQEVFATGEFVRRFEPDTSVVVELGGEDAKVIFFDHGLDQRMNGSCAGGTGAFIDQMAVLLNMSVAEMDAASLNCERIYPIASRCGVFAKSDIQPLINQGARKEDIAMSIYQSVVNQTVSGLAQGRRIEGKVLFLGGPLYFCKGLRRRFQETLKLDDAHAVFPEYARYAVALGACLYARENGTETDLDGLIACFANAQDARAAGRLKPLFETSADYEAFRARHAKSDVPSRKLADYAGDAFLGIDCGSTTTKLVLIDDQKRLLYSYYASNNGHPVDCVREQLARIYELCGDRVTIRGSAVTGYGEDLIRAAFSVDEGLVETLAHFAAARHFCPDVDFILDIGGQDIKCFRIRGGAIDSIMLNEACSSGCGSFLETFARSMGMSAAEFAARGLEARAPVDLGSRCTVFMNSSVKQAQKDGATVEDISAGLSVSVVKNALYKVIRANKPSELGRSIVVQGGTFLNDAVLRAFELELGANVIRPAIAGLMGAYGAALHAMRCKESALIGPKELAAFTHERRSTRCRGCSNACRLSINLFPGGRRFISGNRCQKALGNAAVQEHGNLYAFKRERLSALRGEKGKNGRLGLPLGLGMYELAPLWHALFTRLGFEVVLSPLSSRAVYERGQFSIPSDTICYPAKLMHGHIDVLIDAGIERIFTPCLSYNVDEHASKNHYNCPVVAYYPEVLRGNMEEVRAVDYWTPYLSVESPEKLADTLGRFLKSRGFRFSKKELREAVGMGFSAYAAHMSAVRREGERVLEAARAEGRRILILAGRPYHVDPELCHDIDKLAASLGFAVVSEDSICQLEPEQEVRVLNQWTYHARLYRAARYAAEHEDVSLVQLVSFGCGLDAITTDEVRAILESAGRLYTQIKIDEISNPGAVRIRLRSLLGALEDRKRRA